MRDASGPGSAKKAELPEGTRSYERGAVAGPQQRAESPLGSRYPGSRYRAGRASAGTDGERKTVTALFADIKGSKCGL